MRATPKALGQWFLLLILAVALYFCFRIIQPFLMPIFLGQVRGFSSAEVGTTMLVSGLTMFLRRRPR